MWNCSPSPRHPCAWQHGAPHRSNRPCQWSDKGPSAPLPLLFLHRSRPSSPQPPWRRKSGRRQPLLSPPQSPSSVLPPLPHVRPLQPRLPPHSESLRRPLLPPLCLRPGSLLCLWYPSAHQRIRWLHARRRRTSGRKKPRLLSRVPTSTLWFTPQGRPWRRRSARRTCSHSPMGPGVASGGRPGTLRARRGWNAHSFASFSADAVRKHPTTPFAPPLPTLRSRSRLQQTTLQTRHRPRYSQRCRRLREASLTLPLPRPLHNSPLGDFLLLLLQSPARFHPMLWWCRSLDLLRRRLQCRPLLRYLPQPSTHPPHLRPRVSRRRGSSNPLPHPHLPPPCSPSSSLNGRTSLSS